MADEIASLQFDREHEHAKAATASTSVAAPSMLSTAVGALGGKMVQRKLARRLVQRRRGGSGEDAATVHAAAEHGLSGSSQSLPHLERIQRSFGEHDVSDVQAHVGGPAAAASSSMGALAYATGNSVAFRDAPDLHTAAHEAAHIVQQRGGVQLKGGVGESGDAYEQHADAVADRVVAGQSAADLLTESVGPPSGGRTGVGAIQSRAVQRYDRGSFQGLSARRVVTAATLSVYGTTTATAANVIAHLGRGDIVEAEAVANVAGWFRITSAQFSHGQGVAPASAGGNAGAPTAADNPAPAATPQAALNGFIRDANNASTMPVGVQQGAADYQTVVQNLANDYNNLQVFPAGQTTGPTAFRTPYVLADPAAVVTQLNAQWATHQNLQTRIQNEGSTGFKRVRDVDNTRNAFQGKGTPNAVQVIAQAAVDANLTTPGGIQGYINNGPMNSDGSRQNGRWGVDCSGFTAIAVAEMGGAGREAGPGMNLRSTDYRPGGQAITTYGFTQRTVGDTVQAGDVVSWMNTNHVMVILSVANGTVDAQAPSTNPAVTGTKRTLILTMGESSSTRMPGTEVGSVTDTRQLTAVEEAQTTARSQYGTTAVNQSGAASWTLYARPSGGVPSWTLNAQHGIRVQNVGNVRAFSIVRPPSQRATTGPADLGP